VCAAGKGGIIVHQDCACLFSMTAAGESDCCRPSQSHPRADCCTQQNVEVLGASKKQQQQLKGIYRTQNDGGTGSLKECKGTAEECRRGGGDNLTGAVEKELNYADEVARLNGPKPRDGGKILKDHFRSRETGNRFPYKDPRKGPSRPDACIEYIVLEDDFKEGDGSSAAAVFCPKQAEQKQQLQQVQPGTNVCWESFLRQHHVKVLLVEDDDATRHVVSALLRNCNYEGHSLSLFGLNHRLCSLQMVVYQWPWSTV
jgi:hypothetical protein